LEPVTFPIPVIGVTNLLRPFGSRGSVTLQSR